MLVYGKVSFVLSSTLLPSSSKKKLIELKKQLADLLKSKLLINSLIFIPSFSHKLKNTFQPVCSMKSTYKAVFRLSKRT